MGWFPCSGQSKPTAKKKRKKNRSLDPIQPSSESIRSNPLFKTKDGVKDGASGHIAAQTFTFRELAAATKNFSDCLLGEGGFGRVYKGRLESSNQVSVCILTITIGFVSLVFGTYTALSEIIKQL